jgi:hypothetical protein
MVQGNVGKTYYLKGGMNGFYMDTTENIADSLHVYIEETTGGYYLYCFVGTTKTYINCVVSGTHVNGAYEATASTVYTYDAESKTLIADVDGTPYWFGTRNDKTYTTVGPCAVSYKGFYCQFYAVETSEEPVVPAHECESVCPTCQKCTDAACTESVCAEKCEGHETTEEPEVTVRDGNYTVSAYNANGALYFNGTVSSGRFNGVKEESGAAVVTVKTVDGGYILSVGTQYIVMEDKSAGCGFTADASAATVFVWNDTLNTYVVADPDNARAFGCQDTSTYANFSAYAVSNTAGYNWGVFTKVEGTETPDEPVVPAHE